MTPRIFKVAFTFGRGDSFHQGVETVYGAMSTAGAARWFQENREGYTIDAVWEA